jgi:hypothetical protein
MKNVNKFGIHSISGVFIGFVTALMVITVNIRAQEELKGNKLQDSIKGPKVDIQVNKKTDKNGNITQYDSTYTWSWNSNGRLPARVDSVMRSMQEQLHFGFNRDLSARLYNDSLMFNDSAFLSKNFRDFFNGNKGDFHKMFEEQMKIMKKYFKESPLPGTMDENDQKQPPVKEKKDKKEAPKSNAVEEKKTTVIY